MNRARARVGTFVAGACLLVALVAIPSAEAAVSASTISTPSDLTYAVYDKDNPSSLAISGTTDGTTGDHIDLACYDGDGGGDSTSTPATNVAVNADGSFSAPGAGLQDVNTLRVCNLHAIPAGSSPGSLAPFVGPRLLVGFSEGHYVTGGPNDGTRRNYYSVFQQLAAGNAYMSLGGCGVDAGYLLDPNDSLTTITWYCNAALFTGEASAATRSDIRVDGANAYAPSSANFINANASSGFPALTSSYSVNPHTGDAVIHETDPIVKCPKKTYPPTTVSCATFAPTGVVDRRTITQDHDGRVAWITDVFRSTNGKKHKLDLLWDNFDRFHPQGGGDATHLEYEFPGQRGYSKRVAGNVISLPKKPGIIFIRMHGSADGATNTGRGAIVYDHGASSATFTSATASSERFHLQMSAIVPAHGAATFRWAFVDDFHQAKINRLARLASNTFAGCTVPNVVGKKLAAAKKAIAHAGCTVGKITHAHSPKVPAGRVVSEKPKAKKHLDFGARVALVVSKG